MVESSLARRNPTASGSSTVRPQPGMIPTRAWVSANRARSDATRKSQASASSKPPVMATPLIGADDRVSACPGTGPWLHGLRRGAGLRAGTAGRQLLQVDARAERGVGAGEHDGREVVARVEVAQRS